MISKDDLSFSDHWCEILNTCSFNLMALTIQEVSSQLTNVRDEITAQKSLLTENVPDKEKLSQLLEECDFHQKKELEKEITA